MSFPQSLSSVCEIREATADDNIDGVQPQVVARPKSTDETAALMRACHAENLAVVVRGNGSKQSWHLPPERCDVVLETTAMDELIEHSRGDLIATAGAGISISKLQQELANGAHQLVVDDAYGSTLGGAVATNLSGPRRMWTGTIRDLVLGIRFVRADGVVAKTGGKVVKNVAGYDIAKLLTGSFGTLAVITEITVKLHPLPQTNRWVTVDVPQERLAAVLGHAVASQLVPHALELHAEPGRDIQIATLLSGSTAGAVARAEALAKELADVSGGHVAILDSPPSWWGQQLPGDLHLKTTSRLSGVAELVEQATMHDLTISGSAGAGVLYASGESQSIDAKEVLDSVRLTSLRLGGSTVVQQALLSMKQKLDLWGPISALELMRRVKHEFDPTRVLAPGRFVGGI